MKQKITVLLLVAIIVCSSLALVACNGSTDEAKVQSFVSLDINPEINFTVDSNNKVISVYGANEDGKVLIYGEASLVGKDVEDAVEQVVQLAIDYGYLDENNSVVGTSVSANVDSDKLLAKINAVVEAASTDKLAIRADVSGSFALNRQYENFKKENPDSTISKADFKLALAASETGEITLEVAVTCDTSKLLDIVSTAQKKAEKYATEAYNDAVAVANAVYEQAVQEAETAAYVEFYAKRIAKIPTNLEYANTVYYGGIYGMYAGTAAGLKVVSATAKQVEKISDYPLNNTQIDEIITALGVSSDKLDPLKDENGNITISSIEAYANKYFKNQEYSDELKSKIDALAEALNNVQIEVQASIDVKIGDYSAEIEAAVSVGQNLVDTLESSLSAVKAFLPTEFQVYLNDFKTASTKVMAVIGGEEGAMENLDDYIAELEGKANEILNKMKSDLTEEDKKEIQEIKERNVSKLSEAKTKFDNALAAAKDEAENLLSGKKEMRKSAK